MISSPTKGMRVRTVANLYPALGLNAPAHFKQARVAGTVGIVVGRQPGNDGYAYRVRHHSRRVAVYWSDELVEA